MKEIAKEIEGIWTSDKSLGRKRQDTEALLQCALADPAADLAALRSALDCLLRLAERSGLCPPGQKRCEMDMAREALARTERRTA